MQPLSAVRPSAGEDDEETRAAGEKQREECPEEMEEEQETGRRVPRRAQNPKLPSPAEVAEHQLTHLPFRSWCRHCVRGCGQAEPHRQAMRDEGALPEVHLDYCFMGTKTEEAQPILVARDRDSRMTLSFLVREKGAADPYVVRRVIAFLKEIGYEGRTVIVKSDQESPICAVVEKLIVARTQGSTIPENSPVGSSGSKCIAERAIKEVEMRVRCMKSALDERVDGDVSAISPVLPWMIEYASVLINRYLVGHDGKTAYERMKGKASKMMGYEFGELVHFRKTPLPGRLGKLDSLWETGVYVGHRSVSGESMVISDSGVYKSRTLRRLPEQERWSREKIEAIKFLPWRVRDPSDERREAEDLLHEPRVYIEPRVEREEQAERVPDVPEGEAVPRRVYITKAILSKYGMTDGCMGCTSAFLGEQMAPHSEDCRIRITTLMKGDPVDKAKVTEASRRRSEFVQKHLVKDREKPASADLGKSGSDDQEMASAPGGAGSSGERKRKADPEPIDQERSDRRDEEDPLQQPKLPQQIGSKRKAEADPPRGDTMDHGGRRASRDDACDVP